MDIPIIIAHARTKVLPEKLELLQSCHLNNSSIKQIDISAVGKYLTP
jgi:hypothetical protein